MKKLALILGLMLAGASARATVVSQNISATFTCTGTTGPFAFTFSVSAANAITVNQNGTILSPTAYVITPVNNNYDNGGSVTLNSACPNAQTLIITRTTPLTQSTVFADNMPVPMKSFENGLDKLTEIAQELGATKGGSGSVNSVAVANANGFQGTVLNPNTNPTISISVDSTHVLPTNTGNGSTFLNSAGTYTTLSGSGLPAGATQDVQINGGSGVFGTDTGKFTYNTSTHTLNTQNSTSSGALTAQSAQGIGNTDTYTNGGGNNGIANFFAAVPGGTAIVPPTSTDTENLGTVAQANTSLPTHATLKDLRSGGRVLYQKNPTVVNGPCSVLSSPITANCFAPIITGNTDGANDIGSVFYIAGEGYNSANNGSSAQGWSSFHDFDLTPTFLTRGIKQSININQIDHSAGDDDPIAVYDYADGGCERPSDECVKGAVIYPAENTSYFHGTISSGGTTGATSLTTTNTSGQNAFTDEGYLLDITKGSLTATYASEGTHDGVNIVNYSGSSLPVSTAWGTLNTGTTVSANGKYQIYAPQTITMTLSADSPGSFAVGNNACIVSPNNIGTFVEQVPITAANAAVGTQQQITFSTRYGWNAGAFMMQGGMCGQIATSQATPTWRSGSLVVGSFSATQIVIGGCSPAGCNDPNVYNALGINGASAITAFYPGAEIIGTGNGTPNFVQLATNTVAFANGDTIENPHPASVSIRGASIGGTQVSLPNGTTGAFGLHVYWRGPNCNAINCTTLAIETPDAGKSIASLLCMGCLNGSIGTISDAAIILPSTTGVATIWENYGPSTGHMIYQTTEGNRIASDFGGGTATGFTFTRNQDGIEVPVIASNTPLANATTSGQLVISQLIGGDGLYRPGFTTMTGDCGIIYNGTITCTKINGITITGAPSGAGQEIISTSSSAASWQTPASIANVQITLPTGTLTANTCSSVITTTMTGVTTTSTFTSAFASDASGVTGYGSSGGLSIVMWPTANTNNLKLCNPTASSITPGAMTLNVGAK